MEKAGLKGTPLNKRIWLWLRDHKGKTASEIAVALGVEKADVTSTLSSSVTRGVVTRKYEHRQCGRTRRQVFVYEVVDRDDFVWASRKVAKSKWEAKGTVDLTCADQREAVNTCASPAQTQVDTLTVAQARELFSILHKMFGTY
jgi:predicted transcriptional regulator